MANDVKQNTKFQFGRRGAIAIFNQLATTVLGGIYEVKRYYPLF